MRISDWSSDVCSSDLVGPPRNNSNRAKATSSSASTTSRPTQRPFPDLSLVRNIPTTLGSSFAPKTIFPRASGGLAARNMRRKPDRQSFVQVRSVAVRVDLGGGGLLKKKKK